MTNREKKPVWLKTRLGSGQTYRNVDRIIHEKSLHTVCEEAMCPNRGECWGHGRATFMILGESCSRNCRFCNVAQRAHGVIDPGEPQRIANAVADMGLRYVVLTSVTRDDLPDRGSSAWAQTIRAVREIDEHIVVEVLVPDFDGKRNLIETVLLAGPAVFGHNLETVSSLYEQIRPQADYTRSLSVLKAGRNAGFLTKTSIMVGLGETDSEVENTIADAYNAGCRIIVIGQYLQPTPDHIAVSRYVEPSTFDHYGTMALDMGFNVVVSRPLARSSYYEAEQEDYVRRTTALRTNNHPEQRVTE